MKTAQSTKLQKGPACRQAGFTLIELLVVIGILAILLAIVLIAINPARQFAQANNTKRSSDIQALLNAIHQYSADNAGTLPAGLTAGMAERNISTDATFGLGGTNGALLCNALVTQYLAALPADPSVNNGANISKSDCASFNTGYTVSVSSSDNRITLSSTNAQLSASISATR